MTGFSARPLGRAGAAGRGRGRRPRPGGEPAPGPAVPDRRGRVRLPGRRRRGRAGRASGPDMARGRARARHRRAGRGPDVRAVPGDRVRRGGHGVARVRGLGPPGRDRPPRARRLLRARARRGRGVPDRRGRVHAAAGLGNADGRVLPAGRVRAGQAGPAAAALVTLAFGKVSGMALLGGLLLLAARSGSLALASFAHVPAGGARATAQALLLAGFAVKVGLVPFQVWLPRGYAAAPGPARAVMAGVAVNVGFYGLWRTLAVLGPPPGWLTGTLLVLAGLTAVLGIAHAAVQTGLLRVIAYSSVENAGPDPGRLRRRPGRRGRPGPAPGRGRAAGRDLAGDRAHGGQVAAVHRGRGHGIRGGHRRPGRTARGGAAGAVARNRPGHRRADPGRAAAHRRVRLRMVPARSADAAVPGAGPGLPAGARGGGGRGRADRRVRRGHLRPADRPGGARPAAAARRPPGPAGRPRRRPGRDRRARRRPAWRWPRSRRWRSGSSRPGCHRWYRPR